MTVDAKPASARAIFSYRDAEGRERKGDPAELLRRLTTCCGGDPNLLFRKAEYPQSGPDGLSLPDGFDETASLEANERLGRAVCRAFRLGTPWDDAAGQGVPEAVWQKALDDFLEYVQGEVGGADGTPTCAPPSAPEALPSPTASNSGSGSTAAAP